MDEGVIIHIDGKIRAVCIGMNNFTQNGVNTLLYIVIIRWLSGNLQICVHGIKIPQRGICSVIERVLPVIRKHIRDHAVMDILRKGRKNFPGIRKPPGGQCQPGKSDHGISAPVGKPRKTCKDCHKSGGIAPGKKLVCCHDKCIGKSIIAISRLLF